MLLIVGIHGKLVNFEEQGAIAEDLGLDIAWKNGNIMNETLKSLQPGLTNHFQYWLFSKIFSYLFIGDIFMIPNKYFYLMGGIKAWNLESVTFQLDGTLVFSNNIEEWPKETNGKKLSSHKTKI